MQPGQDSRNRGRGHGLRVMIVDDHALLRAGTAEILRQAGGFEVVGEAGSTVEAMRVFLSTRPDAALVDIRLPDGNGIDLARRLPEIARNVGVHTPCRVIILSAYDDDDYVEAAMDAGVAGYLLKTMPAAALVHAVRAACAGETILDPSVTRRLARQGHHGEASDDLSDKSASPSALFARQRGAAANDPRLALLTERELEVVDLVGRGLQNKEIGQLLGISTRTVEAHLSRVFDKLGTRSRTALARIVVSPLESDLPYVSSTEPDQPEGDGRIHRGDSPG